MMVGISKKWRPLRNKDQGEDVIVMVLFQPIVRQEACLNPVNTPNTPKSGSSLVGFEGNGRLQGMLVAW
jgi:hypothetical protein